MRRFASASATPFEPNPPVGVPPIPESPGDPPPPPRRWPLSPYMRSDEAAEYLRFPTLKAFQEWARRRRIPCCRRGRVLLYERRALDALVGATNDDNRQGRR